MIFNDEAGWIFFNYLLCFNLKLCDEGEREGVNERDRYGWFIIREENLRSLYGQGTGVATDGKSQMKWVESKCIGLGALLYTQYPEKYRKGESATRI